jgi:tetratricopeptide (TPR) repeat protein
MEINMRITRLAGIIFLLSSCTEKPGYTTQIGDKENTDTGTTSVPLKADSAATMAKCKVLLDKANEYSRQGKESESITADSLALDMAERAGITSEMITIIKRLERKYAIQLKRTQSYQLINKGLALARQTGNKEAEIDFISARGMWYFYGREFHKALPIAEECLVKSRKINYSFGVSSALADIGSIYMNLNDKKKGADYFMQCRPYADSLKGTIYEAQIYQLVASAYTVLGQKDSVLFFMNKACNIALQTRDKRLYAACQTSLADVLYVKGDLAGADSVALRSISLCREINFNAQIISTYLLLRNIAEKQGNHKKALQYYEAHVAIKDSINNDQTLLKEQEKEYAYNIEKKEHENLLLSQKNQLQAFQISQTRYVIAGFVCLLILILIIGYLLFRQARMKTINWKITAGQKLLRAQMNPHFIFNSLNSIRYFILSNQNTKAENYLSTFSRLIRNSLEASIDDTVTVEQEVEMLKGYLDIEALRFNGVFDYEIRVDDTLKGQTVRIPQFMIQPFVENAIWHGLLPKKAGRKLIVQLSSCADTGKVRCMIDDNGIGRVAAAQNKSAQEKKHLAVDFVRQRLLLYKKMNNTDCKLTFTDKIDENGDAAGLTVVLELPNMYLHRQAA